MCDWLIIGPPIISLLEDYKCSINIHDYSVSRSSEEEKKKKKRVSIVKTQSMLMIRPTSNASHLVQLFGL